MLEALPPAAKALMVTHKSQKGRTLLMDACQYHATVRVSFLALFVDIGVTVRTCVTSRSCPGYCLGAATLMTPMNGAQPRAISRVPLHLPLHPMC
jgi:hypothetical protein